MRYCPDKIHSLDHNQVFVFGSNEQGFHGAGAAGVAQRGIGTNTWRQDKTFNIALKSPPNSPLRKGKWAYLGQGRGYQEGNEGASYAIATVVRPGQRKSIPLSKILIQLKELGEYARQHPEKEFFCCIAGGGYNGWTVSEIQGVYRKWCQEDPPPQNVLLKKEYEFRSKNVG